MEMKLNQQFPPSIHLERDKFIIPFLLSCSEIGFLGTKLVDQTVYFQFCPSDLAKEQIEHFYNRTAPPIHPLDLMRCVDRFKNELAIAKDIKAYE